MARPKVYSINLTDDERAKLNKVIKNKTTCKTVLKRCQVLRDLDESKGCKLTHAQIAHTYTVCPATVSNIIRDYVNKGIDSIIRYHNQPKLSGGSAQGRWAHRGKAYTDCLRTRPGRPFQMDTETAGRKIPGGTGDSHKQGNHPQGAKKNELQPHRNDYWCIPPKESAEFVACMEDVLDIYEMPYNPDVPVVCMDEKPYQLLGEAREPLPMRPGDTRKTDSEYIRNGTCSIFVFVEPLGGIRHVSVREHRTATDWAEEIKYLVDTSYPDKQKIILVMDNLNTHAIASLYKTFPAHEARRIARKLEIHYTPKHGSWLDMAEIELNVMTRQCLSRRIAGINELRQELAAWETDRNRTGTNICWHFTADNAREKLVSLYPKFEAPVSE